MRLIILLVLILFLTPLANAFTIPEGAIIKPNSSASGYYILNKSVALDRLENIGTNISFINLTENNRTVQIIDNSGNVLETICSNQENCTITQSSTIKNILFTTALSQNIAQQPSVGGSDSGTIIYDFSCDKMSCYYCNLKCNVIIKNTKGYSANATAKYDMWIDGEKHTIKKKYYLEAGKTYTTQEYLPINQSSKGLLEQLGFLFKKDIDAKVIANFEPYSTKKVALFGVGSVWSIYKLYILASAIIIIVTAFFARKRIKARKVLKAETKA